MATTGRGPPELRTRRSASLPFADATGRGPPVAATTGRGPPELRTRRSASLPNPQFLRSNGRDALSRVRGHAGRVTLPGGMRGAPAAQPRTRQARQSAFADAKGRVAAHLRASSKRAAPLFRPFGPDAPAGHERPLSRDTNFLALHLPDDFASQEQNGLVVFAQRGWRFASQEQMVL